MYRLPFRLTFGLFALTGLTLFAAPPPAVAASIPAKRPRHAATARHVSLLPVRAKIETLGRLFDEPQWLDRDTVIAHVNIGDGFFQTPYQINLRTEHFRLLKLKPEIYTCKPAHWSLSPDKKWVLWRQGWGHSPFAIFATRLDGRGSRSWPLPVSDCADCLWLPRSRRWVSFRWRDIDGSFDYEAVLIHNLDAPKAPPKVIPLPAAAQSASEVVGGLPDGQIVMVKYPSDSRGSAATAKLFLIDLHAPRRMRQIRIALPKGMQVVNAIHLSPDGRSLAWDLCDASEQKNAYYVSDLSGRKMRLVTLPPIRSDEGIGLRGWYSDSRSLLFEVQQAKEVPKTDYLCWVPVS